MNSRNSIGTDINSVAAFLVSSAAMSADMHSAMAALYQRISEQQLLQLKRAKIDSLLYRHLSPLSPMQSAYNKVWALQRSCLASVIGELDQSGTEIMIYKGAEYVERFFDSIPVGLMQDLDVIVPMDRVDSVKETLRGLGFRQADLHTGTFELVERDIAEIAQYEQNSYELFAFSKVVRFSLSDHERQAEALWVQPPVWVQGDEAVLLLTIDVHNSISNDIQPDFFWQRRTQSAFCQAFALDPTDQLWVNALRYYFEIAVHETTHRLRDLAYMARLMAHHNVDWSVIVEVAEQLEIRPALFYVLSYLARLCNKELPADVLAELAPSKGARTRDFGWQVHKLFGEVSEMPLNAIAGATSLEKKLRDAGDSVYQNVTRVKERS